MDQPPSRHRLPGQELQEQSAGPAGERQQRGVRAHSAQEPGGLLLLHQPDRGPPVQGGNFEGFLNFSKIIFLFNLKIFSKITFFQILSF